MTNPDRPPNSNNQGPTPNTQPLVRRTWPEYIEDFKRLSGRNNIEWFDSDASGLEIEAICWPDKGSETANEVESLLSESIRPLFDDARRLERHDMYHEYSLYLGPNGEDSDPHGTYTHFLLTEGERAEIVERLTDVLGQRLSSVEDPSTGSHVAMWNQDDQAVPLIELSAHDLLVLSVVICAFSPHNIEKSPDTDDVRRIQEIIKRDKYSVGLHTFGAVKLAVNGQLRDHQAQEIMLNNPDDETNDQS